MQIHAQLEALVRVVETLEKMIPKVQDLVYSVTMHDLQLKAQDHALADTQQSLDMSTAPPQTQPSGSQSPFKMQHDSLQGSFPSMQHSGERHESPDRPSMSAILTATSVLASSFAEPVSSPLDVSKVVFLVRCASSMLDSCV